MNKKLKHLSLFTGAGGGELGSKLLGWETLGYVEWTEYCQKVIAQRIKDGIFDEAPIFSDIRTFVSEGYARRYRGMVDVVSGGFPCQPFSVAGKQQAQDDERNMWDATISVIREVQPRYCFLENVSGLLAGAHGYFGHILGELAESGYDVRWRVLSATEMGAPHKRDRLWILAHTINNSDKTKQRTKGVKKKYEGENKPEGFTGLPRGTSYDTKVLAHTLREGLERDSGGVSEGCGLTRTSKELSHTSCKGLEREEHERGVDKEGREIKDGSVMQHGCVWWNEDPAEGPLESRVGRMVDGVAHRSHRIKAIGNGQVPAVAAKAWMLLSEGLVD